MKNWHLSLAAIWSIGISNGGYVYTCAKLRLEDGCASSCASIGFGNGRFSYAGHRYDIDPHNAVGDDWGGGETAVLDHSLSRYIHPL